MSSRMQIAVLRRAIDAGAFTKESALQGVRTGMKQRMKRMLKRHEPITFQTLTTEIRNDKRFLEQIARVDVHMEDIEGIANDFLRPGVLEALESEQKIGRNEPCPCGSGKKYKKCCGR